MVAALVLRPALAEEAEDAAGGSRQRQRQKQWQHLAAAKAGFPARRRSSRVALVMGGMQPPHRMMTIR